MGIFALFRKHFPLSDAEAVLLIRDNQGKGMIKLPFFEQGMSSDYQICLTGGNLFVCLFLFRGSHGAYQQNRAKGKLIFPYIFLYRFIMLQGKHLSRCHKGALIAVWPPS